MLDQIQALNEQIAEKQKEIDNFDVTDHYSEEDYRDMLNDETVDVMGNTFSCGDIFYRMDYTAFRCGYLYYCDGEDKENYNAYNTLVGELEELENERDSLQNDLDLENERFGR